MKYTIKYLIDFIALVLLYAFVFFKKWKTKGKDSESSVHIYEYGSFRRCDNRSRGFY